MLGVRAKLPFTSQAVTLPAFLPTVEQAPNPYYAPGIACLPLFENLWAYPRQHSTLPSSTALQKQKAQMSSMGYSKLFNLGYFSATVSPLTHFPVLR